MFRSMVAPATTTPLPALSKADKLRLTLYFSLGQSVEALALELLDIHRDQQARVKNNNPEPATFHEALPTENTALAPILSNQNSGTRDSALSTSPLPTPNSSPPSPSPRRLRPSHLDPLRPHRPPHRLPPSRTPRTPKATRPGRTRHHPLQLRLPHRKTPRRHHPAAHALHPAPPKPHARSVSSLSRRRRERCPRSGR